MIYFSTIFTMGEASNIYPNLADLTHFRLTQNNEIKRLFHC